MAPILDIVGHCPACRSQSLHLMPSGMIQCLHAGCPEPGVVNLLLMPRQHEHWLRMHEDGWWTIMHPLSERLDPQALFSCLIAPAAGLKPGWYRRVDGTWTAEEDPWPSQSE